MMGVPEATSIYLVESGKKCLIDGGTGTEVRKIIRQLKDLDAFPPDMIILTHSHWDHTQGVPLMSKRAEKLGKPIEILASEKAIPHLRDQSFNEVFGVGPFDNIEGDVTPLKEGDVVELKDIKLKILDTPGHKSDHIAVLDTKNRNIFLGDAIGIKVVDNYHVPPFMPPEWDSDAFLNTIEKLKKIDYEGLSLGHFGYVYGEESKTILDDAEEAYKKWWKFYEENVDILDDIEHLSEKLDEANLLPKSEFKAYPEMLLHGVISWLASGFKVYKNIPLQQA